MSLEITALNAGYGPVPVLRDVSLHVDINESVAIVGSNGAGKTTLVRAICGLSAATAGKICFDGKDISRDAGHLRPKTGISVVLETRGLFSELTVNDNLRIAEVNGIHVERPPDFQRFTLEDVFNLFPVVREKKDIRVELLSGGQQQMVAVARALLLQPRLLILDELTTGLAPKVVQEILLALDVLRARGMSLLIIEQNIKLAASMTDRAYVMSLGKVVHEIGHGGWEKALADDVLTKAYLHG